MSLPKLLEDITCYGKIGRQSKSAGAMLQTSAGMAPSVRSTAMRAKYTPTQKDTDRFWSKADRSGGPDACWLWTSTIDKDGYGRITLGGRGGRLVLAHRFAYETCVGPIPDGLVIDHLCRTRNCVNPSHMEPVTNRENFLRGTQPNAMTHRTGICQRGHEMTEANTYLYNDHGTVKRRCRTCLREVHGAYQRAYRARRRNS